MATKPRELTKDAKEDIAFALLLLKDFKSQGLFNVDIAMYILNMADHLGVRAEFDELMPKIPPMKIEERYP